MGIFDFLRRRNKASGQRLPDGEKAANHTPGSTGVENPEFFEQDLFDLVFDWIPNLFNRKDLAESSMTDLSRRQGSVLVEWLNHIRLCPDPYTEATAKQFSVKAIPLYSVEKHEGTALLMLVTAPPLPVPQQKFTSCIRFYVCFDNATKDFRILTIENNRMMPSLFLCEAGDASFHATLGELDCSTPEQEIARIAEAIGCPGATVIDLPGAIWCVSEGMMTCIDGGMPKGQH